MDDIIVTGNDSKELEMFITKLNKVFDPKDLGPLHYFLGIGAYKDDIGIYLSHEKYISELLQKFDMKHLKLCPTPMTAGKPIPVNDGEPLLNPTIYRSVIGALQYLIHTRPDISFTVNKLSQLLESPTIAHWSVVKRIMRYLKGTIHHGLHISHSDRLALIGYSDADWACCLMIADLLEGTAFS
ncbi:uncharacterized mitochondrial protein AtMg00810-like [Humulus lupulus]|uniref:uncharacterized mitochondrial protein AtMg00810-like n=1 Tax=Humulus lupulus TaxID=3486 RepID=UPI002B40165E|nr:uncharacterized mitochondrial protein AtMg00810-like [Humulus lupulus]